MKYRKIIKDWLQAILVAVLLWVFINIFIAETLPVNTIKMEQGSQKGDLLLINKFRIGARLPITILSIPFCNSIFSQVIQLPYFRIPGISNIQHNNIIAFNIPTETHLPIDKRKKTISRCIGLPGDTIEIKTSEILINGNPIWNKTTQYKFTIITDGTQLTDDFFNQYKITEKEMFAEIGIYHAILPSYLADSLIRLPYIRKIKRKNQISFPNNKSETLVIPSKNSTIALHISNIEFYKTAIQIHEGQSIDIRSDMIYINNIPTNTYTFGMDYYYVVDDNRDFSNDSRTWGLLPESHIIGIANTTLYKQH